MDQTRLNHLIDAYKNHQLTQAEAEELDNWFHSLNLTDQGFDQWIAEAGGEAQLAETLSANFNRRLSNSKRQHQIKRMRWSVAASILLVLSAGSIYLIKQRKPQQQIAEIQKQDIPPGGNKAILTLANGKKISLTDAHLGTVAQQANVQIKKAANGQIVYIVNSTASSLAPSGKATEVAYNTVETPKGGQTSVILPDGTLAFLDAASSIRFPVTFTGNERKVAITGQVYFQVIHNSHKPFRVSVKDQTVEDIGTGFNIKAYDDEPNLKVTLVEGKASVRTKEQFKILHPGQAAITNYGDPKIMVTNADIEETMAWKNGLFIFNEETLQSEMREISRWYNVEFVYPTGQIFTGGGFGGSISRFGNISDVLKMLEVTGDYHFQIDGRKVIVTKKRP